MAIDQSGYQKFARDILFVGVANLLVTARGLIFLPLIAKTLGASDYGLWIQIVVTLMLLLYISVLGLDYTLNRFLAGERDRREIQKGFFAVLFFVLGWSCLVGLAFYLLARPIMALFFGGAEVMNLMAITAAVVPIQAVGQVLFGYFRAFRQMKTFALLFLLKHFGELALAVSLVLVGLGIFGAAISLLVMGAAIDVIMLLMVMSRIGVKLPDFSRLKPYFQFSLPLILSAISFWFVNLSDRYLVGYFLGVAPVGIYSAAYALGNGVLLLIYPLSLVLTPTLSKLWEEGHIEEVKRHLTYSLKYFLLLAIPAVFGLSVLAKPILLLLSTEEFVPEGGRVLPFLVTSYLLYGVYNIIALNLVLVKQTRVIGILWAGAAALNVVLNLLMIPPWGIMGAAVATLIAFFGATALTFFFSFRQFTFLLAGAFVLKSLAASLLMALALWKLNSALDLNVFLLISVGVAIYFAVLLVLRGLSREEIRFLRGLLRLRGAEVAKTGSPEASHQSESLH